MKKNISDENKKKLEKLVRSLDGVQNKVPNTLKTVFNFKGRKSIAIAETVISSITAEEDIIYDPFMGSGTFVISSVMANRRIVATELDNYTYAVVSALFQKIDFNKLDRLNQLLADDVKSSILELYATRCCNEKNYISKVLFDPQAGLNGYYNPTANREIKDGKNVKLVTACPICGQRSKSFDAFDEAKLKEVEAMEAAAFPTCRYIENSRINITASTGADRYDRIFTQRNKIALVQLQKGILKLEQCPERDVLEHALVSALSLSRIAMYGSSTDVLYHVVPYGAQDMNVWELFQSKVDNFINFKIKYPFMVEENPQRNQHYKIFNLSYQDYCKEEENKAYFDLIYTDFPYTDQVPYLERNQLYRIWLDTFYAANHNYQLTKKMLDEEIVETNAPSRPDKDINRYYDDLDQMFLHCNEILKSEKLLIFTIKLGKSKYFTTLIEIINLARKNGFEYALRIGIDKTDPSLRKQSAYHNTLAKEMIVVFQKLKPNDRYWYIGNKNYEYETIKTIYFAIKKSKIDLSLTHAINKIKEQLLKKESYIVTESDLDKIKSVICANFIVESDASVRIDSNKLYLDIEDTSDLFSKFYHYIPVIIRNLLKEKGRFDLDDLYFEIANTFCNGDPKIINQFLADPSHQRDIERLLHSYCKTDGKTYERKDYDRPINKDAIDISTLDGYEFEDLIVNLLRAEGFEDVLSTGGSGDLGVDIVAKKYDHLEACYKIYLFQCKRWASNVGSEAMQRLVSEKFRRNADYAVCMTTSDYTADGLKISREQEVEAVNGESILKRLDVHFKDQYYNSI